MQNFDKSIVHYFQRSNSKENIANGVQRKTIEDKNLSDD